LVLATLAAHCGGVCLSSKQVVGVDINARAVETINRGEIHIVEPDLDRVVKEAVEGGFLRASTTPVEADAYLIAVPTPFKGDHEPDMVSSRRRQNPLRLC
jgi:UDP-N-acetyl-D-mannosaminuronic acid dehydrogenase